MAARRHRRRPPFKSVVFARPDQPGEVQIQASHTAKSFEARGALETQRVFNVLLSTVMPTPMVDDTAIFCTY